MEKKDKSIQFSKSGNGAISPRISIPNSWIEKLGVTEDDKKVTTVQFSNGDILITKDFNQGEIMKTKLMEEAYQFGVNAKTKFIKLNKKDKIHFYSAHILQENQKEKNDVIYYILNMCLDLNINSENFFIDILFGDKQLVQSLISGLMS
ncbi:hypothetical protein [uncultured Fusobacterium sp.]|jgi:antitoxin component of MazEF toxin-antitoxin module|uniref:hypothetical protein n=1 Tax=uncultured Fusobacterium sp. TaxID=159267 RepID=UPI0025D6C2DF|nr:hypothetical protein [uncultured Fusobacterium sp.]